MDKRERYKKSQLKSIYLCVMKDLSQFSQIYLIPLADFHIGARNADLDAIQGYLDWIKGRDNAFTILNGDMMNCAWKDSTPELYEDLITPDDAYHQLRVLLEPIKNKILMITRGGHEYSIFQKVGADYMARLAYDLGDIPYKPDGGLVGIRMSKNKHKLVFWIYATHGWGGARTIGAKVKKTEDLVNAAEADVYILSHDHTQNVHRLNRITPPRSHISFSRPVYWRKSRQLLVNTGGFLDYSGYIQRKGYVPQDIGTPRVRLEIKNTQKGNIGYYKDIHSSL